MTARPGEPCHAPPGPSSAAPIPRRRALQVIGGTVLAGIALPVVLEACAPTATPALASVTLEIDPATLRPGEPIEVPFTLPASGGRAVPGSAWLVKDAGGSIVAFDPRCTHAQCAYAWSKADGRFDCHCHKAAFDLTGKVLFGPPPRPLDRFPATPVGGTVTLQVPGDFSTPRPAA
jgi:menaquinol-cytochrome c reductase iron-sulfur subunit